MAQLNKKIEKNVEDARYLALAIMKYSFGAIFLYSLLFGFLGIFSPESPFSDGEQLGYVLAVLIPCGLACFLAWFRYLNIKNACQDLDCQCKDDENQKD